MQLKFCVILSRLDLARLDLAGENVVSLSANHLQKLRLSFQLTTPLGHVFKPHQVCIQPSSVLGWTSFTLFSWLRSWFGCSFFLSVNQTTSIDSPFFRFGWSLTKFKLHKSCFLLFFFFLTLDNIKFQLQRILSEYT